MFGKIEPPYWNDRPVVIVGGGPSLKNVDFRWFNSSRTHVLCVNQAMLDVPACTTGISIDFDFVHHRRERLAQLKFPLYVAMNTYDDPIENAINLKRLWDGKLSDDPETLISGGSSGYAALNLAYLKRAKLIYLFGFDYGADAGHHYHHEYTWFNNVNNLSWKHWAIAYHSMLPQLRDRGVRVINATTNSNITVFTRMPPAQALAELYPGSVS